MISPKLAIFRTDASRLARAFGLVAALCNSAAASAGTITYYHNDLLGSAIAATNASGQVIWREGYRPYGERLTNDAAAANNKAWYTSRRQDGETGLVYMGARYYDPAVGRFMGADPKLLAENNMHSFNRYAYANNNPYRYKDPDGRASVLATTVGGAELGTLVWPGPGTIIGGAAGLAVGALGTYWIFNESSGDKSQPKEGERIRGLPPDGVQPPVDNPSGVKEGPASRPSEREKGGKSLWDEHGGEWRYAPENKHHNPHWDYNPHDSKSSPWQNIPIGDLPPRRGGSDD